MHVSIDLPVQGQRELAAALKLQCWYRGIKSRAMLSFLASSKVLQDLREMNAAKVLQKVRWGCRGARV